VNSAVPLGSAHVAGPPCPSSPPARIRLPANRAASPKKVMARSSSADARKPGACRRSCSADPHAIKNLFEEETPQRSPPRRSRSLILPVMDSEIEKSLPAQLAESKEGAETAPSALTSNERPVPAETNFPETPVKALRRERSPSVQSRTSRPPTPSGRATESEQATEENVQSKITPEEDCHEELGFTRKGRRSSGARAAASRSPPPWAISAADNEVERRRSQTPKADIKTTPQSKSRGSRAESSSPWEAVAESKSRSGTKASSFVANTLSVPQPSWRGERRPSDVQDAQSKCGASSVKDLQSVTNRTSVKSLKPPSSRRTAETMRGRLNALRTELKRLEAQHSAIVDKVSAHAPKHRDLFQLVAP